MKYTIAYKYWYDKDNEMVPLTGIEPAHLVPETRKGVKLL
jgi:hypothetical protein